MKQELEMIFCKIEKCSLLKQACLKRQYLARNPQRKNPSIQSVDYSRCKYCEQGKEIFNSNKKAYLDIEELFQKIRPTHVKEKKKRGREKITIYKCKDCGETDETKFKENRKTQCIECKRKYNKEYMKKYRA